MIDDARWAAALALLSLAGCAGSGTGEQSAGTTSWAPSWLGGKGGSVTVLSTVKPGVYEPSTLAIGEEKDIARHREDALGYVRSAPLEQYLNETHARLIAASGKSKVPGRVMILAVSTLDALSSPDGNVYVAMGLLESLESSDEVAAVLAHETAHVLLKHHSSDVLGEMEKRGQALYELGIGAKTVVSSRTTVAKSDAQRLQQVQLAADATDKLVLPAWSRSQEREADFLGVDLLAETRQSPPAMVSFLEKFQAWEKGNAETEEGFWARVTQASQRNVNDAASVVYQQVVSAASAKHPKTEDRIKDTAQYFERHYGSRELVEPKSAPWTAALRNRPEVAQVLRNYKQAFAARKLLDQGKALEAYATARTAVTGRTATDAYPNWVLSGAALALGRQRESDDALKRAINSTEPVPKVYEDMILRHEGAGNFSAAIELTDQASKTFGGAPSWRPHKIRLLRKAGRVTEAASLTMECSLSAPDKKHECQEANQTQAGRVPR